MKKTKDFQPLRKGAIRRLFGKFNPRSPEYKSVLQDLQEWQGPISTPDFREQAFSEPTSQSRNERMRSFNKLSSITKFRRNPSTGEREFLLHRGMGPEEMSAAAAGSNIHHTESSSWTPHYPIAMEFARHYHNLSHIGDTPSASKLALLHGTPESPVVSAWIPESKISGIPNQLGSLPEVKREHEVIVKPFHNSEIADLATVRGAIYPEYKSLEAKLGWMRHRMKKSDDPGDKIILSSKRDAVAGQEEYSHMINGADIGNSIHSIGAHSTTKDMSITKNSHGRFVVLKAPLEFSEHKFFKEYTPEQKSASRPHSYFDDKTFQTSNREAAFHHIAKNVFGLGQFVPNTTIFKHPKTGKIWSAQDFIEESKPYTGNKKEIHGVSDTLLSKLAIMDTILGNQDRNKSNVQIDRHGFPHMIDNAFSFDYSGMYGTQFPTYARHLIHGDAGGSVHKWINKLDPKKLYNEMKKRGVPEELQRIAIERMESIKDWSNLLGANPGANRSLGGGLEFARINRIYPATSMVDKDEARKHAKRTLLRGISLVGDDIGPEDANKTTKEQ